MTEDKNARTKALMYLKEVIGDDSKFNRLNKGEPIDITGSQGGKYILYPNGHVVRLDKDHPKLGKVHKNEGMPYPDVLATVYVWITKDEKRFLDNWGCGNISVTNPNANVPTDQVTPQVAREIIREEPEEERESWWDRHFDGLHGLMLFPAVIMVAVMAIMMLAVVGSFSGIVSSLNSTISVTPTPVGLVNTASTSSSNLSSFLPLLLCVPILAIVTIMIIVMGRRIFDY